MQQPIDPRILRFIREHHILNLATVRDNIPWCCTCYYAYLPALNGFVITSDPATRHVSDIPVSYTHLTLPTNREV